MPFGLTVTPLWLNPPCLHLLSMACFWTYESPANRVDTRDYRIYDRILLKLDLRSRCCPRQDPTRIYQKSQLFADCQENCVLANFSGFLEALCYKGFVEIDFWGTSRVDRKHQKEQLLEHPAARSHRRRVRSHFGMLGSPVGIYLDT